MRLETIIKRAESLGLPIAKDAFRETRETPLPEPPYLVYITPQINGRGGDDVILVHEIFAALELYTDKAANGELEKLIEEKVFFDTDYQKYQDTIEDEDMVQTAYEFTIYEKVRRKGIYRMDSERITLGSGKLYCMLFTGEIPEDTEIETENNQLAHIKGGASVEYTAETYTAKDDLGVVSKTKLTNEDVILKAGLLTWCAKTLKKLSSTARVTEDTRKRTVKIGGIKNQTDEKYLIRFLHEDEEDGDIRVTIVGKNEAGFSFSFAKDAESTIEPQFKAHPMDKEGTLLIFDEEIPQTA